MEETTKRYVIYKDILFLTLFTFASKIHKMMLTSRKGPKFNDTVKTLESFYVHQDFQIYLNHFDSFKVRLSSCNLLNLQAFSKSSQLSCSFPIKYCLCEFLPRSNRFVLVSLTLRHNPVHKYYVKRSWEYFLAKIVRNKLCPSYYNDSMRCPKDCKARNSRKQNSGYSPALQRFYS